MSSNELVLELKGTEMAGELGRCAGVPAFFLVRWLWY